MRGKGGYGIVFQTVMRNKNLSPEAKAIYAYLCSFAGNKETCHPSVNIMSQELGMSKGRLSKYMKELIACGVVERTRSISRNLLSGNVYRITHNVDFVENENCDFSSIENSNFNDFGEVKNKDIEKRQVNNGSVENLAPNNNSIKSNSINNNSNINTSEQTPENGTGIFMVLEDDSFYDVLPDKLSMWQRAYPDLDVERELYQMASWCDANPTKRKTRRGIEKFINGWLNRSQKDSKKEEVRNDAAEPETEYNPEDDPEHVPDAREVWERLKRQGRV